MSTNEDTTARGIHWTLREVLRGKSADILVISAIIATIASMASVLFVDPRYLEYTDSVPALIQGIMTLKADAVAKELSTTIVFLSPLILVLWLPVAAVIMAICNIKDRNLPRSPENLKLHEVKASRAWTWPWSVLVGTFDFSGSFSILTLAISAMGNYIPNEMASLLKLLASIACLVFAERRVRRASLTMVTRSAGNQEAIAAVLDGSFDCFIPEKFRNELGRTKTATVIRLGVVRTPRYAALLVSGINLRTKLKLFSGFLNSAIHGVISAVSFGIASTVSNMLGYVGGRVPAGGRDEIVEFLTTPEERRPLFIIEILATVIGVVYVVIMTVVIALYM